MFWFSLFTTDDTLMSETTTIDDIHNNRKNTGSYVNKLLKMAAYKLEQELKKEQKNIDPEKQSEHEHETKNKSFCRNIRRRICY